jgi:hypothetical protein
MKGHLQQITEKISFAVFYAKKAQSQIQKARAFSPVFSRSIRSSFFIG